MKKYYSDINVIKILRVLSGAMLLCIIIVIYYLKYLFLWRYAISETLISILLASLITAYVLSMFVILPMWQRSLCYVMSEEEIILFSGIIFKKTIRVKLSSIQYIKTVRCPIFSKKSFNFLLLNIYGDTLILAFLSLFDMEEIDRKLKNYIRDAGGF